MRVSFNFLVCRAYHQRRTVPLWQTTCAQITRDYPLSSFALLSGFDPCDDVPLTRVCDTDDYQSCHDKTFAVFDRCQAHDADWLVIADDDTWFNLANLHALLFCLPTDEPIILGNTSPSPMLHAHGGSGILINSRAYAALAAILSRPRHTMHSDLSLALCVAACPAPIRWAHVEGMHGPDDPLSEIKPAEAISIHTKDRIPFRDLYAALGLQ